jgi:hypothetical protein
MEMHIKPETESRLTELASKSGRATDDLVEDAICVAMRHSYLQHIKGNSD